MYVGVESPHVARGRECVCVRERERLCVPERGRKRERKRVGEREQRESERERARRPVHSDIGLEGRHVAREVTQWVCSTVHLLSSY